MRPLLRTAYWEHHDNKASLISGGETIAAMQFSDSGAAITIGHRQLHLRKKGLWSPQTFLTEGDNILAVQRLRGFWSDRSEIAIAGETIVVSHKQRSLYHLIFSHASVEVLTYKLDAGGKKPAIAFEIKETSLSDDTLLLLLVTGFHLVRGVAIESLSSDFIITAVG